MAQIILLLLQHLIILYTSSSSDPSNLVRPNPYYTFVTKFGQSGSGNGEFSDPFDADVDPDGNIYVTDDGMNRVQKFDNNGNYVSQFGTYGTSSGELAGPTGIKIKRWIYLCCRWR